jgi:hypothetical protein
MKILVAEDEVISRRGNNAQFVLPGPHSVPSDFDRRVDTAQTVDTVGSVIGDRTRTLRLERAAC